MFSKFRALSVVMMLSECLETESAFQSIYHVSASLAAAATPPTELQVIPLSAPRAPECDVTQCGLNEQQGECFYPILECYTVRFECLINCWVTIIITIQPEFLLFKVIINFNICIDKKRIRGMNNIILEKLLEKFAKCW